MKISVVICIILVVFSCRQEKKDTQIQETPVILDIQGHRGARGLMPENTIPAFLEALKYDHVTTLELDLAVTRDGQLVVSHEPWFNHEICYDAVGEALNENDSISLYSLTYEEVRQFDCGSKGNPKYPDQQLLTVSKPLLKQVLDTVDYHITLKSLSPGLRTFRAWVYKYRPVPERF
ncbi:MAG: glycerophosphodiester phosphodiesterase family protein [Bacteroidota bacterium]